MELQKIIAIIFLGDVLFYGAPERNRPLIKFFANKNFYEARRDHFFLGRLLVDLC